jgi:hypothetical protein
MIANFFKYCFEKWWRSVLFWLGTGFVLLAALFFESDIFQVIAFVLFVVGSLSLLITSVYQLVKKRWWQAALTAFLFGFTCFISIAFILVALFITLEGNDGWADKLTIPPGITEKPLETRLRPDTTEMILKTQTDLQLYMDAQPGMFVYDLWLGKIAPGTVHLKAFEITQNYRLSPERLKQSSVMNIANLTDSIKRFPGKYTFTIYEGDWGKPYAARFEVWYRADGEKEEIKLLSKNYIIEGWQR